MTASDLTLPWAEEDETKHVWSGKYNLAGLKAIASCVNLVHEANPASWSLLGTRKGAVALTIWGYAALSLPPARGHLILPGSPDDERYRDLPGRPAKETIAERGSAFRLQGIDASEFLRVFRAFQGDIRDALVWLAGQESKGTFSRNGEHRPDLVQVLAQTTNTSLPQPSYFSTSNTGMERMRTGIWFMRQPSHVLVDWRNLHREEQVRFVWPTISHDLSVLPSSREAFCADLVALRIEPETAQRLWRLVHEIQPGDTVVMTDGPYGYCYAKGTVTGGYNYYPEDTAYPHRLPWAPTLEKGIWFRQVSEDLTTIRHGWGPTPITEAELTEILTPDTTYVSSSLQGDHGAPSTVSFDSSVHSLARRFATTGLHYSTTQIATFYTALQTKGFVVLSGISGTGKSKIAQGFVEMLPVSAAESHNNGARDGVLSFTTDPIQTWAAVPASQADRFPPISQDAQQHVVYEYDNMEFPGTAVLRVLAGGKPTLYFSMGDRLSSALRERDSRQRVFASPEIEGERLRRVRLALDPRHLVGDPPSPEPELLPTANHLFLSVRPDWRDSTSLLGYYNPLTETYEWTEFLRFLLRAADSHKAGDGLAWFVILDEMNLAHVEYYFADLLSVIESGRDERGLSREPLRLQYPETLIDNAPPAEVYLPPNLYIIGTVNMDETTHAFSPKVLDRAFTIELTEVDFSDYPGSAGGDAMSLSEEAKAELLTAFTRNGRFAIVDKEEIREIVASRPELRAWLQALNDLLRRDRFHFGYRVFDEIAQFVANAGFNGMLGFEEAFDHAVFMKVLPKFTGSRARLRSPLLSLLAWAVDPDAPDVKSVGDSFLAVLDNPMASRSSLSTNARFPHVATRALQMLETLEIDGFVSFG